VIHGGYVVGSISAGYNTAWQALRVVVRERGPRRAEHAFAGQAFAIDDGNPSRDLPSLRGLHGRPGQLFSASRLGVGCQSNAARGT